MTDARTRELLKAGATAFVSRNDTSGWQKMDSAPRNGTVVELRNNYGVVPWYSISRWGNECTWSDVTREGHYQDDNKNLMWRPFAGRAEEYVDPTNGMQNEAAYWRGAVAQKYGLPIDHFEAQVKRNERANRINAQPTVVGKIRAFLNL